MCNIFKIKRNAIDLFLLVCVCVCLHIFGNKANKKKESILLINKSI